MDLEKYEGNFYVAFRIIVGLLFFQHGAQKLLGWFGGSKAELISLFGLAGVIELVGGLMIAVGLFTRVAAAFGIVDMIGAYFRAHVPNGAVPIMNNGELALLYLACFLIVLAHGSMKAGLDNVIKK